MDIACLGPFYRNGHVHASDRWTVELNAVVVMPDHVHMVFVPKIDMQKLEVFSLARITKAIKGASAHLINRELGRAGRVWQEESFDRVLRISEKLDEKIAYILNNPVRKGLTQSPQEYRWLWAAPVVRPSCARLGRLGHLPLHKRRFLLRIT